MNNVDDRQNAIMDTFNELHRQTKLPARYDSDKASKAKADYEAGGGPSRIPGSDESSQENEDTDIPSENDDDTPYPGDIRAVGGPHTRSRRPQRTVGRVDRERMFEMAISLDQIPDGNGIRLPIEYQRGG